MLSLSIAVALGGLFLLCAVVGVGPLGSVGVGPLEIVGVGPLEIVGVGPLGILGVGPLEIVGVGPLGICGTLSNCGRGTLWNGRRTRWIFVVSYCEDPV